jgi:hypothetical protein
MAVKLGLQAIAEQEDELPDVQTELFGDAVPFARRGGDGTMVTPRRAGRPVGKRNQRSEDLIAWYRSRGYLHPLEAWGWMLTAGVDGIMQELRIERAQAAAMWATAAKEAAPYLMPKLTPDVAVTATQSLTLIMDSGSAGPMAPEDGALVLRDALAKKSEQDQ